MRTKEHRTSQKKSGNSPFFNSKNGSGFIGVQPKLNVGKPGDNYEKEADHIADKVVQHSNEPSGFFGNFGFFGRNNSTNIQEKPLAETISPLVQRQEEEEEELQTKQIQRQEEEEELQMQPMEEEEEELQMKPNKSGTNVSSVENQLHNSGKGQKLDSNTKAEMENSFGADFSNVSIHTGPEAVQMNRSLNAQAFTHQNDIYFNSGKYNPDSAKGKHLLAHELTHTIQQQGNASNEKIQRWPWSLSVEEQKRLFRSRDYGPITYTQSRGSGSGFEASYSPAAGRLNVTVRGKIRFADTLVNNSGTFSSPNSFMNQAGFMPIMNNLPPAVQSKILPFFQWNESEKQIHLIRFRENLEAARSLWQDTGMSFQVDETGWEDITATPDINLDITEGQAAQQFRAERIWGIPFLVTDESTSDHLQVEIVKQPSAADFNEIKRIITEHNAATGSAVTSGMIRGVRSYQGNDPGSRGSAPEGFNNLMSLESDRSDDTLDRIYSTSVRFENNESELSDAAKGALDSFFSDPMILVENSGRGIDIDLQGFASAPGTTGYNRSLVERRIAAVESYIDEKIINSDTSVNMYTVSSLNDADTAAETDLESNPATHDPAVYRRVDITITREGRTGQNVFAHELGHIFGLGDEYVSSSRAAGSNARHDQLARNAGVSGGAQVANDNRIMSTGNVVGPAHYSTFADALNRLTSKRWKILTS